MGRINVLTSVLIVSILVISGLYFILPRLLDTSTTISTNYYFDATNGSDSNTCQSSETACKTLAKLNTITLNAGDNVYFKRGEMWSEALIPSGSGSSGRPITFDAYGSGTKPIITGESFINGSWVNSYGSEYKIVMATEPYILYENGSHMSGNITNDLNNYRWKVYSGNTYVHQHYSPDAPDAVFDYYNGTWNKLTQGSSKDTLTTGQYFFETNELDQEYIYVHANNSVNLITAADGYVYTTTVYKGGLTPNSWFYDRNTQELYVRLSDSTHPQTNEVGYAERSYNILLTNQSYLIFKNLQLDRSNVASIHHTVTNNKKSFIFDNIDINYYGQWGIRFSPNGGSGNNTVDGITIKDTNIIHGPMKGMLYPSTGSYGNVRWSAIQLGGLIGGLNYHNNVLIQRVKIKGGGQGSGGNKSAGRDGIGVYLPTNYIVEYTEVTGVDHGIYAYCDEDPSICSGIIWRYNYVHDNSDDALWGSDHANSDPVMIYSNVIKNVMDLCIGFSGPNSKLYVTNNTCEGFYQGGIALQGTGSVAINNIFVKNDAIQCLSNNPIGCFVEIGTVPNNYTVNNNIYYDSTGTYGTLFRAKNGVSNCITTSGCTVYTFEDWQTLAGSPDSKSFSGYNPYIKENSLYYSVNTDVETNRGNRSICDYGIRLLHKDSVWPDNVITINPCKVDIGAYMMGRAT